MWAEIGFGVAGPVVSTTASWLRTRAAVRNQPERLTAVMVQSFARKLVFFGAYVVIALKVFELQPTPFVIAFTTSFVVLLFAEAVSVARLTRRAQRACEEAERGEAVPSAGQTSTPARMSGVPASARAGGRG